MSADNTNEALIALVTRGTLLEKMFDTYDAALANIDKHLTYFITIRSSFAEQVKENNSTLREAVDMSDGLFLNMQERARMDAIKQSAKDIEQRLRRAQLLD